MKKLDISVEEHENALEIWDYNSFQLHLRRPTDSCFVSNYFDISLLAWKANTDIKLVFDYNKFVTYMCSYLSKQEDECSEAMKQAFKESLEKGAGSDEQNGSKYSRTDQITFVEYSL